MTLLWVEISLAHIVYCLRPLSRGGLRIAGRTSAASVRVALLSSWVWPHSLLHWALAGGLLLAMRNPHWSPLVHSPL